jgi:Uma2 family endonuclease
MALEQAALGYEPFTYRDLEGTPDDGRFYELSNGVLVVTPGPSQEILIEADLFIRDDLVKRPDIQVVDRSLIEGQAIRGTPALVVEISSLSTALLDRTEKRVVYAEAGIPAYWIVDLDARTVTVLDLDGEQFVERAVLVPGEVTDVAHPTPFTLDVVDLFV